MVHNIEGIVGSMGKKSKGTKQTGWVGVGVELNKKKMKESFRKHLIGMRKKDGCECVWGICHVWLAS